MLVLLGLMVPEASIASHVSQCDLQFHRKYLVVEFGILEASAIARGANEREALLIGLSFNFCLGQRYLPDKAAQACCTCLAGHHRHLCPLHATNVS